MNNIFENEVMVFESNEAIIASQLTRYIVECDEAFNKKSYITEKEHKSLITHLKEFFEKIITAMNNFKNSIKTTLERFKSENSLELRLRQAKKKLQEQKNQGEKYIETIDLYKYEKIYTQMINDLWKEAKKFARIKYKNVNQIDRDLETFHRKVNKYDIQLKEVEDTKIKMKIDDAITFVSREIGGNSQVIKTIEESEIKVREMEREAEALEQKRDILGSDVIPRHVSLIKRIITSITGFIRKKVSKFVGIVVFLFAI